VSGDDGEAEPAVDPAPLFGRELVHELWGQLRELGEECVLVAAHLVEAFVVPFQGLYLLLGQALLLVEPESCSLSSSKSIKPSAAIS
jgi:hypothetical protein